MRSFYAADLRGRGLHALAMRPTSRPQTGEHSMRHVQQQRNQDNRFRTCSQIRSKQKFQGRQICRQKHFELLAAWDFIDVSERSGNTTNTV
jgi:hypothetical protein